MAVIDSTQDMDTRNGSLDWPMLARTILVVDPKVLSRFVISEYLREGGYRVYQAANAEEAVTLLQTRDILIDLVVSDVQMPGAMDGSGLVGWVRANRPEIEVVLTCEAGPLLAKPYEPQIVLDRIQQLLARAARTNRSEPSTRVPVRHG
jgi:CheY-like chemotaxis protein